ncbi:hypothetical protein [Winogradskyella ouciana]|uniref:GLPGLI family protein n=1 Tax=Winogradskyella ouciana TaxID=2608631 RepID=A0A7K1GDJ7_9FLAO|nr:hypothetical protein [Winogradskyella ouciana]MTE27171.1 hypothetical protein [Winogradskyella ouciana]
MKSVITLFCITLFMSFGYAQDSSSKSPHYILPEFTEGIILMKDGSKLTEVLNYNALSENFAFKKDDEILAMTQTDIGRIDTVYVSNRKFIRKDGVFLELLMKSEVELYLEHKCNLESSTAASGGYGGTSQTTSGRTVSSIENRGNLYGLELPEMYKVKPIKEYWFYKDDVVTKFKSLSQLKKLYKDRKKDIKTYRKTHDVDTKEPLTIVQLIEHLESDQ